MEYTISRVLNELELSAPNKIKEAQTRMREHLGLDTCPFEHCRRAGYEVHELPKDDERRLSVQALFLFVLRPHVPLKYETVATFVACYPDMHLYSLIELERLRVTANWMDLAFYTLNPKNNKTFLMTLIPRICEGRLARYITGSGETRATADRVSIYRTEGKCAKIIRPPRKRTKIPLPGELHPYGTS